VHAEEGPLQALAGRRDVVGVGWGGQHHQEAVAQEVQAATGAQQACRFWKPLVGITPDRRAVLADGEVEAGVRKRGGLGVPQVERERDAELDLKFPRGFQLLRGVIDPHRASAPPRQPG